MKENLVLSDLDVFPTEEVVFSHIGREKKKWKGLFEYLEGHYSGAAGEWRYYRDGKSWLCKVQYKKKTVCWLTVVEGAFRISFYFGGKAEKAVKASLISEGAKEQYLNGPRYGKIRAIAFRSTEMGDISDVCRIIDLKIGLKG